MFWVNASCVEWAKFLMRIAQVVDNVATSWKLLKKHRSTEALGSVIKIEFLLLAVHSNTRERESGCQ